MSEPDAARARPPDDETLVPLDVLEAAWQEVETVQAESSDDTPGTEAEAPAAPTPSETEPEAAENRPAQPQDQAAESDADSEMPEAKPKPAGKGVRFVIGKRKPAADAASEAATPADAAAPAAQATAASDTGAAAESRQDQARSVAAPGRKPAAARTVRPQPFLPRVPWWKHLLRALDDLLDVVNRPFSGLSPGLRSLIGVVSLTTIVVSLSAAWLIPTLFPHRDAITFLEAARAQVLSQTAQSVSPTNERAERPAAGPERG